MNFIKTAFASATVASAGLFASAPDTADAQVRFSIGVGNGGYGYNNFGGYRGYGFNSRGYGYGRGYGGFNNYGYNRGFVGRGPVWHDTSHYDYHPTTVVPHGNHYDVVPGHYHRHNTGHWH